jgi:chemotaxis protein methyltransferase CheR
MRLLTDELLPRLLRARLSMEDSDLSVWCAGCSSGEEVYTIALLLQTALSSPAARGQRASVLGTDVSREALLSARAGDYTLVSGLNSFRDVPEFARHYFPGIFSSATTTWSASPEVRRSTRFQQHNLVTDPPPQLGFDLILCRNTLIYFEEAASRAALRSLESALRPGGVLMLGPAESPPDDSRLKMTDSGHAMYWSKPLEGKP